MIVNGAQEGVAGFGLQVTRTCQRCCMTLRTCWLAHLDTRQTRHCTVVPLRGNAPSRRSRADLRLGSQTPGLPEELRIEVYIPPYLNQG